MSKISEFIRKAHHSFCTVVVVAAGNSTRMGKDKLLLPLDGIPILARTLTALNGCQAVDEIIVVTREDKLNLIGGMREEYSLDKLTKVVLGGATRTQSALSGVSEADSRAKIICIHDGVRPFVTNEIIEDVVHYAVLYHASAPALPVKNTIKRAKNGVVIETPDRSELFAVQTPQAFQADIIKAALTSAVTKGQTFTDDCAAVEAFGIKTYLSRGSEENIKITTPPDLSLAEAILRNRSMR